MDIDTWAELFGFTSGLLLLVPAFRANRLLREVAELRQLIPGGKSQLAKDLGPQIVERLTRGAGAWRGWDQFCLRGGTVLLALSFGLKLMTRVLIQ